MIRPILRRLLDPAGSLAREPIGLLAFVVTAVTLSSAPLIVLSNGKFSVAALLVPFMVQSQWLWRIRLRLQAGEELGGTGWFVVFLVVMCLAMLSLLLLVERAPVSIFAAFLVILSLTTFVVTMRDLSRQVVRRA